MVKKQSRITPSSGNVYEDLRVPEAATMMAKAEIAAKICNVIKKRGLTQTQAAKTLKVDQPKVSALMAGKLSGFSTERLFRFLTILGLDVEILVRKHSRRNLVGNIIVREGGSRRMVKDSRKATFESRPRSRKVASRRTKKVG